MLSAEASQPLNAAYKTQVIDLGYDVSKVVSSLTSDRLTKYYQRVGCGEHNAALRLYCWNHEVGAASTVLLQQFEVCLRNHISAAVRDKFGADWFRANKLVGYNPEIRDLIAKAHAKARENRNGFDPAERDIIAASSMGMWRELCKPEYAGLFWGKRIHLSFPHAPAEREVRKTLEAIHGKVQRLVKLRNRIAHHEHVLGSLKEEIGEMLTARHADICDLLSWMSPDFLALLRTQDKLHTIIKACPLRLHT
jgi:hypothetical protein